jgi:response regulator RpfG family c-di-GMP phosphodiesterase
MIQNAGEKTKILCVDDELGILQSLERFLRISGYEVYTALSGAEGLAFLAKNHVDLIIVDQRMPNMTGSEFLRRVCREFPGIVSIMLSGQSDFESLISAVNEGEIFRFVSKPWDNEAFLKIIAAAVARKRVFSFAQQFLRGEQHIPTTEGDVRIQTAQDEQGIHVRVLDGNAASSEKRMFAVLNAILDSLGVKQDEKIQILSGAVAKQKGKLILLIEIASGVVLNIEIP